MSDDQKTDANDTVAADDQPDAAGDVESGQMKCILCGKTGPDSGCTRRSDGLVLCGQCTSNHIQVLFCTACGAVLSSALPPDSNLYGVAYCRDCDPARDIEDKDKHIRGLKGENAMMRQQLTEAEHQIGRQACTILHQAHVLGVVNNDRAVQRSGVSMDLRVRSRRVPRKP